jgi:hypothetical protein
VGSGGKHFHVFHVGTTVFIFPAVFIRLGLSELHKLVPHIPRKGGKHFYVFHIGTTRTVRSLDLMLARA